MAPRAQNLNHCVSGQASVGKAVPENQVFTGPLGGSARFAEQAFPVKGGGTTGGTYPPPPLGMIGQDGINIGGIGAILMMGDCGGITVTPEGPFVSASHSRADLRRPPSVCEISILRGINFLFAQEIPLRLSPTKILKERY